MDEDGFILALQEVEADEEEGQGLEGSGLWKGEMSGWGLVDNGSAKVEEWVNQEWAQVFNDEDGTPCNLRAKILDKNGTLIIQTSFIEGCGFVIGQEGTIGGFRDAKTGHWVASPCTNAYLGGDALVEVVKRVIGFAVRLAGEVDNGFAWKQTIG